jgi:hypothetical protein
MITFFSANEDRYYISFLTLDILFIPFHTLNETRAILLQHSIHLFAPVTHVYIIHQSDIN